MNSFNVPGVIIHHVPAVLEKYVGCPSLCILEDGTYLASHSHFGNGSDNSNTYVYRSANKGASWVFQSKVEGQIWSNLFTHKGSLYLMGTDHCDNYGGRLNGRIVIRRSDDSGLSWSSAHDSHSGLLSDSDGYHTAPVPIISHKGKLWRSMEYAPLPNRLSWKTFVLSIPEDEDLLERSNWIFSDMMEHSWSKTQWIEGNVLVNRKDAVVNLLRTNFAGDKSKTAVGYIDRAVLVNVSEDGKKLYHDPDIHSIAMPGGGTKFTARYDSESDLYWALVNKQLDPVAQRNKLYLVSSRDLFRWTTNSLVLDHPDPDYHAFQYVDWVFDGRDIIFVSRTAYDDKDGGAHRQHDANYLTFHRVEDFRNQT